MARLCLVAAFAALPAAVLATPARAHGRHAAKSGRRPTPRLAPRRHPQLAYRSVKDEPAWMKDVEQGPQTSGWSGFGPGAWPGGSWRPYSASSPFNQKVAGSPVVHGSAAMVSAVLSRFGDPAPLVAGTAGTSNDYSHPVYFAQSDEPLMTLHATENWGPNALDGMQIPVPPQAQPADGGDGHMTVVTPDGWEYDFWQAHRRGNQLDFSWGGRTRINGDGLGSGATASLFGNLAGIIRPQELAAGHIDHALFITLGCTSSATGFGYGTRTSPADTDDGSYVYPAEHGGTACSGQDADIPPLGARFMLDMSNGQIQALNVPTWQKTILTALANYGGYVGDTGGPGFGFEFESGATYTSFGIEDPLVALAHQYDLPSWHGEYGFDVGKGVDWQRYLRIVAPPAQSGSDSSAQGSSR